MGIKDLLKFMKPHVEPIHVKKYSGNRMGIDAYSWLHKGAYSCSMELSLDIEGDKKLQYLNYFMHRINLLRHYKITPVVVFDGGNIPSKTSTEQDRHRRREANRQLALAKLKEGNVDAASELFQRAICITPRMAHQLIQILRSENVEFIVAPYEADAQLAYMASLGAEKGGIVAVISEDSDLLAYGCPAVVYKMDRYGNGEEIVLDKVFDSAVRVPSFQHFSRELFTGMSVLAGCDFLPSVPGIGICKAYSLVSKYRNLERVLSVLKFEKGSQMPDYYLKSFWEAFAVFHHARVYDADIKMLKHIKPVSEKLLQSLDEDLDFLGPDLPPSIATAIAQGNLDPTTMEAFDQFPSSESHLNAIIKINTSQFPKKDDPAVSSQSSCFSAITSHKSRTERLTVMQQECVNRRNYLNEAGDLSKLASPESTQALIDCKKGDTRLKVPENNPFKKTKVEELHLGQDDVTEEVSVVSEVEATLCTTPELQESLNSKAAVKIDDMDLSKLALPARKGNATLKVPENNPFKRRKVEELHLDQDDATEEVSVVSEVETTLCITPELQESLNSKAIMKIDYMDLGKLALPARKCNTRLKVPENNPFKKRKVEDIHLDHDDVTEIVSEVSEVETNVCKTPESQESVNSKAIKKIEGQRNKGTRKSRPSNCDTMQNKTCSILNFFSRV